MQQRNTTNPYEFYPDEAARVRCDASIEALQVMRWLHNDLDRETARGRGDGLRHAFAGIIAGYAQAHANGMAAIFNRAS